MVNVNIYHMFTIEFYNAFCSTEDLSDILLENSYVLAILKTDAIEFLVKSQEFSEVLN